MPIKMALLQLFSFLVHHKERGEPCLQDSTLSILDLEWDLDQPTGPEAYDAYLDEARRTLGELSFDVVAISCWSSLKYRLTQDVAALCKELNPQATIMVGGWHPSACPEDFEGEECPVDSIIIGEGEWAFLDALRSVSQGESLRRPDGQPGRRYGRLLVPEEEVELRWDLYPGAHEVPTAPIFFSRGCPFTCNYCMEPYTKGRTWRALPPERAVERVKGLLRETNARYIDVHDPIFAPQPAWRRAFFEGLESIGFDRFIWTESRSDIFKEVDLATFARFDLQLDFGIETASEGMLKIMAKTAHPHAYLKRTRETLLAASKHDLTHQVYLITNHPGERLHHVKETLSFFEGLIKEMPRTSLISLSPQPYRYYPGTALSKDPEGFFQRYGTVVDDPFWWRRDVDMRSASACTRDTHLSPSEQGEIDETWATGVGRLNRILMERRSDRASRIIALRSAGYLDLHLLRERWEREGRGPSLRGGERRPPRAESGP